MGREAQNIENIEDLMKRFITECPDENSVQKTASHKDGEQMAAELEAKGTEKGEEAKRLEAEAEKSGDDPEGASNKGQDNGKEDQLKQGEKPTGEHNNSEGDEKTTSSGMVTGETNPPERDMEKVSSDTDIGEILKAIDQDIVDRYTGETYLKKAAEDVVNSLYEEIQKSAGEEQMNQLASTVHTRVSKKAQSDEEDEDKEKKDKKDGSGEPDKEKKKDEGESSETSESESTPVEPPAAPEEGTPAVSPEPPAVPVVPEEGAPTPAPEATGEADGVDISQYPEEVQQEINALVDDIHQRLQAAGADISREEVLQELNSISQDVMGGMQSEQIAGEVDKAAKDSEMMELMNRLEKLSAELGDGEEIPAEGTSEEVPAETAPAEEVPAESAPEEDESDAMAAAMMDQLSQEEVEALQQAVVELQEQGVDEGAIADAVKAILTEQPSEDVQKVASEDDFKKLREEDKLKFYVAYSLQNAHQNQNNNRG